MRSNWTRKVRGIIAESVKKLFQTAGTQALGKLAQVRACLTKDDCKQRKGNEVEGRNLL